MGSTANQHCTLTGYYAAKFSFLGWSPGFGCQEEPDVQRHLVEDIFFHWLENLLMIKVLATEKSNSGMITSIFTILIQSLTYFSLVPATCNSFSWVSHRGRQSCINFFYFPAQHISDYLPVRVINMHVFKF